jgi:photosystem II stability/assembly factor-like uncharacterized protein
MLAALPAGVLAAVATGDGIWVWQNPRPQGNPLNAGWFSDADNGWFVGDNGTIMHTPDGGASWVGEESPTPFHLTSVCFPDAMHGWAVGNYFSALRWTYFPKAIITTSDGGKTWRTQETSITGIQNQMNTTLSCVRFSDAQHGWAVGVYWHDMAYHALILATSDGGAHWSQQGPKTVGLELRSIACVDSLHAWAVGAGVGPNGADQRILATDDGGITWRVQNTDLVGGAYDVDFLDAQTGWVVGQGGKVAHTLDGGKTWTTSDVGWGDALHDVAFTDALHGIAIGENAVIRTSDGGATWQKSDPLPNDQRAAALVPTATKTWLVGTIYRDFKPFDCSMLSTSDQGETWTKPPSAETSDLHDVCFVSPTHGFAAGAGGCILSTTNAGLTWSRIESGVVDDLRDIEFIDTNTGWVVGGSTVLRTADGGTTWQAHTSPVAGLQRACFVDALHGWAVTDGAAVLRTEDGGLTWTARYLTDAHILTGVTFVDALHGWVSGGRQTPVGSPDHYGVLFRTSDGGLTWDVQYRDDFKLTDVQFTDLQHGWFVIGGTGVYRTTDGGATWSSCPSNVQYSDWSQLHRIDMLDARHGWAVGTNGGILATGDGEHWVIEKSGTQRTLWGVSFVDPANGWIAGDGGVILKDPGPLAYAPYRSVVRRGSIATLKYKISDAAVVRLSVVIRIRNSHNRLVKKLVFTNKSPNRLLSATFRCRLARGKYTFHVSATDSAGMKTAVPAVNRLTVR